MITDEQIAIAMVKQMKDDVDWGILEKMRTRFILGPYLGQPYAVRVRYDGTEINQWIEQQPRKLWRQVENFLDFNVYLLDEKLYTMFLLRWA